MTNKDSEGEFYFQEEDIHLYDADHFIANIKSMMAEAVPDVEFTVYFGVNDKNCLDVWVREENEVMYEIEPTTDNLRLTEREEEEDE